MQARKQREGGATGREAVQPGMSPLILTVLNRKCNRGGGGVLESLLRTDIISW